MEGTVKERIKTFITYEGISIREFERRCGMSTGYMAVLRHAPGADKLSAIFAAFPQLSRTWLLTGEGGYADRFRRRCGGRARHRWHALLWRDALPAALARVRDLFIFSAYTGLAYSDAVTVTPDDIVERGGRRYIDTTRRKTGSRFITPLLDPAAEVFDRYGGSVPNISNQKANEQIHAIERLLGLTKPLTTHVARHTFATTVALANGVPIDFFFNDTAPPEIYTTQIYAKVLAQTVVDDGAELAGKIR